MSIRDDFFNSLKGSAVWDVGVPIKRANPLPLDSNSVFESLDAATEYANGVFSYPGQVIAVVGTDGKTAVYVIDANKALQDISSGSAMLFVDTIANLNKAGDPPAGVPDDLKVGQQAFVSEDNKVYYLTTIGSAVTDYVWKTQASDAPVWDGNSTKRVNFVSKTLEEYNALTAKDEDTLYVITDKNMIFKGATDVTSSVVPVTTFDSLEAIEGKLYVNTTDFKIAVKSGESIAYLSPGYLTDGANWADADSNKLATLGLIKKGIAAEIAKISLEVSFAKATGTVSVGEKSAVLTDVAHAPTYDASTLKLTIPVYGGDDVVVNIPKDKFVKSGKYYADYPEKNPTQHNVIVLEVEQGDPVIIPAEGLVDVYTADNTGKNLTVTISDDNKVSASLTLDPTAGNALVYSDKGFMVDISGKMDTYGAGVASQLLISDATGKTVTRTGKTILSDNEAGTIDLGTSATQIPVASIVARAIATAVNAAKETLQTAIDGKMDLLAGTTADAGKVAIISDDGKSVTIGGTKLSDLATKTEVNGKISSMGTGTADVVVTAKADGSVQRTTKTIGGATFAADTASENVIPTEKEVTTALSWQFLE